LFIASSFSAVFLALFSASASMLVQSLFLTMLVSLSVSAGNFSRAALHFFSVASSSDTSSNASSGQNSMHFGSPSQRSQVIAMRLSGSSVMPPCGHAWMHQSQPLHLRSLRIRRPLVSDWVKAFSGQAFTHGASLQNLHVMAALSNGVKRRTRILDFNGFHCSHFSRVHAYSQMPQPVHLPGSTETYFLELDLAVCICFTVSGYVVCFLL